QDGCDGAVIVNSWLTDDDARRILPATRAGDYAAELAAYRAFPTTSQRDVPRHAAELCAIEAGRFRLARALFEREPWDHFFCLFSSTDWLGHILAGRVLGGDAAAQALLLRLYRQLDGYVGWFRERAPDATFALLSDHGQCAE